METYKKEFIDFMVESGVLKFGSFVTKSGRNTPFFINAGNFSTGAQLDKLGSFYAKSIMDNFGEEIKEGFDVLFGPAYKGIPLATTTGAALFRDFGVNVRFASDRKEAKDHGEGGKLLGGPIKDGDRVIIIEDVTTAGTSIKETYPVIKSNGDAKVFGLVIAVDRMEMGSDGQSATAALEKEFGFRSACIVNMREVSDYLRGGLIDDELMGRIEDYYRTYGAGYFA